jgi:hypothetical protein
VDAGAIVTKINRLIQSKRENLRESQQNKDKDRNYANKRVGLPSYRESLTDPASDNQRHL